MDLTEDLTIKKDQASYTIGAFAPVLTRMGIKIVVLSLNAPR